MKVHVRPVACTANGTTVVACACILGAPNSADKPRAVVIVARLGCGAFVSGARTAVVVVQEYEYNCGSTMMVWYHSVCNERWHAWI